MRTAQWGMIEGSKREFSFVAEAIWPCRSVEDGEKLIILLTGGNKKSQKRDISKALEYWKDYKARKGGK